MWIYINNLDQVNWLAENEKWAWHLNLFSMTRVKNTFERKRLSDFLIPCIIGLFIGLNVTIIVYKRSNFLKAVVHVITIDQCNQTNEIQVRLILYSCRSDVRMLVIDGWTGTFGTLANSADPDQTSQTATSDQSLHCLLKSQEVKGKWNSFTFSFRTNFNPPVLSVLSFIYIFWSKVIVKIICRVCIKTLHVFLLKL